MSLQHRRVVVRLGGASLRPKEFRRLEMSYTQWGGRTVSDGKVSQVKVSICRRGSLILTIHCRQWPASGRGNYCALGRVIGGWGARMFRHVAKDEGGVSAPEYAILLLLLVGGAVGAAGALNNATTGVFSNTANVISQIGNSGSSSSANTSATAAVSASPPTSSPPSPTSTPSPSPTNAPSPSAMGNHGRSDSSPGHEMQQQGPAASTNGAQGFAPGHNK